MSAIDSTEQCIVKWRTDPVYRMLWEWTAVDSGGQRWTEAWWITSVDVESSAGSVGAAPCLWAAGECSRFSSARYFLAELLQVSLNIYFSTQVFKVPSNFQKTYLLAGESVILHIWVDLMFWNKSCNVLITFS